MPQRPGKPQVRGNGQARRSDLRIQNEITDDRVVSKPLTPPDNQPAGPDHPDVYRKSEQEKADSNRRFLNLLGQAAEQYAARAAVRRLKPPAEVIPIRRNTE